jgi:hypothetical protein
MKIITEKGLRVIAVKLLKNRDLSLNQELVRPERVIGKPIYLEEIAREEGVILAGPLNCIPNHLVYTSNPDGFMNLHKDQIERKDQVQLYLGSQIASLQKICKRNTCELNLQEVDIFVENFVYFPEPMNVQDFSPYDSWPITNCLHKQYDYQGKSMSERLRMHQENVGIVQKNMINQFLATDYMKSYSNTLAPIIIFESDFEKQLVLQWFKHQGEKENEKIN